MPAEPLPRKTPLPATAIWEAKASPPSATDVRSTLVTYLLLTLLLGLPFAYMMSPYFVSFVSGSILAVLCAPLHARLARHLRSWMAGILVTLAVVLLVVLPVVLVIAAGFKQGSAVFEQWSGGAAPSVEEIAEILSKRLPFTSVLGSPSEVQGVVEEQLVDASGAASRFVVTRVTLIPAMVLQLAIVVLSTYFMLVDGRRLYHWVSDKIPLSRDIRRSLVTSFQSATSSVVLASIAAAGAQSLLVFVAFLVLRVPLAPLAAVAAFIGGWIPTVGPTPVWGAAALWLYLQGSPTRALLMVGVGVAVGIIDNIVRPLVLRGRAEMHPLLSLLAILGGIAFLGVPGIFIGPLLASLVISLLDIWPAVAAYSGIAVTGAGEEVPEVPLAVLEPEIVHSPGEEAVDTTRDEVGA